LATAKYRFFVQYGPPLAETNNKFASHQENRTSSVKFKQHIKSMATLFHYWRAVSVVTKRTWKVF